MRFFTILFTLFFLCDVIWAVWADMRLRAARAGRGWRIASATFIAICMGSLIWWMVARRLDLPRPGGLLVSLAMVWHLVILPAAIVALMVWGLVKATIWGWRRVVPSERVRNGEDGVAEETPPDALPAAVSRRQFIGATAAMAPMVLALGSTGVGHYQLNNFRVRRIVVPMAQLPASLDGLTIAHVSDTHVGRFTKGSILDAIVDATNTLDGGKPCDLVLFTGDLINDSNSDLDAALDMSLKLKSRHGAYFVEGNHDLIDDGAVFDRALRQAQLNLLNNESRHVEINGQMVQLLGLQWGPPQRGPGRRRMGGDDAVRASVEAIRPLINPHAFPILLAHHPHALDYASEAGIALTLSGHTHGGQLMLSENIGPGPLMYRYWSGLYRTHTGAAAVISNGVGNWFPLRINAPAEIIHLTLKKA